MALSKLFTPKINHKRGAALDSEFGGNFLNPPAHAELRVEVAPTSQALPTLKLGAGKGEFTEAPGRRPISTSPQEDTNY